MVRKNKGVFVISLDFELFWGVRDHRTLENYGKNIRKVHKVVPDLLKLFSQYGIHCTWATVGFLFNKNKEELMDHLPALLPSYIKPEYDPYNYIRKNELEEMYHFAPALIEMTGAAPGQEIATHTYSHFYTLERDTSADQFRADIKMALHLAAQKGYVVSSIVFPRNQYSEDHIRICRETGIKVYRGNEFSAAYKPVSREDENLYRRGVRLLDTFINLTGHHCHNWPAKEEIINIPASRFLRPYSPKLRWLDGMKFDRIRKSIHYAAQHGLIFHLWWHPHNFGDNTENNFAFLERILKVYSELSRQEMMESLTLNEIYERVHAGNAAV